MRFRELGRRAIAGTLAGILSYAPVRAAEIATVPETVRWVADGIKEYKLNVYVDNTGLGGEPTVGVGWRLIPNSNFNYINGSAQRPTSNDFFAGLQMVWEIIAPPGSLSGRGVSSGNGRINHTGNIGEYKFTVQPETPTGTYHFDLNDTELVNPSSNTQPHTVRSAPIAVSGRGDLNCDGRMNAEDIGPFVEAILQPAIYGSRYPECSARLADMNGDGIVNEADVPLFVNAVLNGN